MMHGSPPRADDTLSPRTPGGYFGRRPHSFGIREFVVQERRRFGKQGKAEVLKRLLIAFCVASALAGTNGLPTLGAQASALAAQANAANPTPGAIVATAKAHLGDRYATIGNSPSAGFSCIGFVNYVFARNGVNVPFDIPQAWNSAPHVAMNALLPGDVLFFSNTVFAGLSHVAIYIGNGEMIGADNFTVGVTTDRLTDTYWTEHYTGATRPLALIGASTAPGVGQADAVTATPTATASPQGGDAAPSATPTPAATFADNNPGQAVATTTASPAAPQSVADVSSGTLLRPLAQGVALYSGPGYQYVQLAQVGPNTLLTVLLDQGAWYSVRQGATYGWVSADQVRPIAAGSSQAAPMATQAVADATPTQAFARASVSNPADLYVADGPLWIRSGPAKTFHEVGSLTTGTPLQLHAVHPHWALVTAPGNIIGWVARQYLSHTPPANTGQVAMGNGQSTPPVTTVGIATPTATIGLARVTTEMLNLRAQPNTYAKTITVLRSGETVRILARRGGWDQVMTQAGAVGWADATWLVNQADNGVPGAHDPNGTN